MEDYTVIGQIDPSPLKTWSRLIGRDHRTGQDHILSSWTFHNTAKSAERYLRANGAQEIETVVAP